MDVHNTTLSWYLNNVVENSFSVDENVVLMIKDVHDRSEPSHEWVTKDVDLGNVSFLLRICAEVLMSNEDASKITIDI